MGLEGCAFPLEGGAGRLCFPTFEGGGVYPTFWALVYKNGVFSDKPSIFYIMPPSDSLLVGL